MKTAILQVADTGPLESLVTMLKSIGMPCLIPDTGLRQHLIRDLELECVLDISQLVWTGGYEYPFPINKATVADMERDDIVYIDVKGIRNYPKVVARYPHLEDKIAWYRINGGQPEHVFKPCPQCRGVGRSPNGDPYLTICPCCKGTGKGFDCGDEVNPPCPVITPNQWYHGNPKAYACWPPFFRKHEYEFPRPKDGGHKGLYQPPICLVHGIEGWGYRDLIPYAKELGVITYGLRAADGVLSHREVKVRLSSTLAMVHLKSNDAPGYALYEALSAACPVICSKRFIWRSHMEELLIDGETCLTFDRATHDPLSLEDVLRCKEEIARHLRALSNPETNLKIGEAGRKRLNELLWSEDNPADRDSFASFMKKWFGV